MNQRRKKGEGRGHDLLGRWQQLKGILATPVNGTSLAALRIAVGLVMALEGYALLVPHDAAITSGTPLDHYYAGADINFHWPYEGFEWMPLAPPTWMYCLAGMLIVAGVSMAIGLWYRASVIVVFSIWAYLFAVESSRTYWQSHFYLELLICCLLLWMPAARRYSVDALRGVSRNEPRLVPFWTIFVLRGQLVITYFYAGVAKFHYDWFMDAVPVRWFLADPNITAPYERFLTAAQLQAFIGFLHSAELAYFLCWTGAIFDVVVGFLLLFRRTRIFGLVLMLIFHATNHLFIFDDIGWFPIVGATSALIFLDPDWPERLWGWLKRPRITRPDLSWAVIGGIVFPVVGVSLGWSLKPTPTEQRPPFSLGRCVVPFVVGWLLWQSLLPIRHHFINSDARFTYEGFSFSWRLKADSRHAIGHSLQILDSEVISPSPDARATIHWDQWRDDPVLYRRVSAGRIVWPALPEIAVILDPLLGERIIYNPYSGVGVSHPEEIARQRARRIWQELYHREPTLVAPLSLSQAVTAMVAACETAGIAATECRQLAEAVEPAKQFEQGLAEPTAASQTLSKIQLAVKTLLDQQVTADVVRPILRRLYPLALYGEGSRPAAFFVVDDPALTTEQPDGLTFIRRSTWKHNRSTRQPGVPFDYYEGPTPLMIYLSAIGAMEKQLLPQAYIVDTFGDKNTPPQIRWNSLQDMTMSKYMHASAQPFYLRRYARRVASLWEAKYGRRPVIHAVTAVSYNGRPHQELVDPNADLASVPVSWFHHNDWVRDLELRRIPRDAVEGKPTGFRYVRR